MSEPEPDPLPEDIIIRLLEGLDTSGCAPPPAGLRQKVMQRVSTASDAGITTVRAQDGEWRDAMPGVHVKTVNDDGHFHSWLARLDPGTVVPAHQHNGDEEILMLEGSCAVGGVPMHAGDYQFSPNGSRHGAMTTHTGCLLFLRTRSAAAAGAG